MGFFDWWRRRRVRRAVEEFPELPDDRFTNEDVILPRPGESREMGEITGVFHTVGEEIRQATLSAQQAKEAAVRITETIGAPPVLAKKA